MRAKFAGSKRKAKQLARDERRVAAVKRRLTRIYELSKLIHSEDELDIYLSQIPDEAVRAATKTLIEPFLLFKLHRVTLHTAIDEVPEKATVLALDAPALARMGPQLVVES